MGIGAVLGLFNPKTTKSRLLVVGGVVLLIFIVWAGTKWDAWKILKLEKENQALDIENQSSQQAAEDAKTIRTIDENVVTNTLQRQREAEGQSSEIQEQVRNDVHRQLRELEMEQRALDEVRLEVARLEQARAELERTQSDMAETTPSEGSESPPPRVVVKTVEVPGPSVDPRIAGRIVGGMWDNYCRQVPDARGCPLRRPIEEGDASPAPKSGDIRPSQ